MNQSYPDQFSPYLPNSSCVMEAIFTADKLGLALMHYSEQDDEESFEKMLNLQDTLHASLYTNGILEICMKKSLEAYLQEKK